MYKALIEIPKGDTRRRHKSYENGELIDFGPIREVIPVNDGVMPVDYGYILGTLNKLESPAEELDVLVLSDREIVIAEVVEIRPVALLIREDNDHKIIATEAGDLRSWEDVPENEQDLIKKYFGHKSKIVNIVGEEKALQIIAESSN